jgi:hypothetical protein
LYIVRPSIFPSFMQHSYPENNLGNIERIWLITHIAIGTCEEASVAPHHCQFESRQMYFNVRELGTEGSSEKKCSAQYHNFSLPMF